MPRFCLPVRRRSGGVITLTGDGIVWRLWSSAKWISERRHDDTRECMILVSTLMPKNNETVVWLDAQIRFSALRMLRIRLSGDSKVNDDPE